MSNLVYLLTGEEFLLEEALDRVREETRADPLAEVRFDASAEPAEIMSALETPSLLGGPRIVVVRAADELKKDQIDALSQYLESPSPHAVLVLVARRKTKLDAPVKKSGTVITLEAPKGRRLVTWLKERAGTHRIKLDDKGAWSLIDAVGTDLRELDGALAQLTTGAGEGSRIGAPEVARAFARLADERIFAFTDGVGERRLPVAMTALRRLLNQGDEPLLLFGALSSHIRRLLVARRHAERGPKAVGDALGLPGWRAERLTRQARSYREEELVTAMGVLAETDLELKGEGASPEAALEKAVVRIITQVS